MSQDKAIGLGEPPTSGKKSLFQPPKSPELKIVPTQIKGIARPDHRLRLSVDVSLNAMSIIQNFQSQHRLATGRLLPVWKILDEALVLYSKSRKGEGSAKE
jgi:hypothetical protein